MPRKQQIINNDVMIADAAKKLTGQIAGKGIPVSRLSEETFESGNAVFLDVTDPQWEDDGLQHTYYAQIWGKFIDVAAVGRIMSGAGTWLQKFVQLGCQCFQTTSAPLTEALAFEAIENLPGAAAGLNEFFKIDWEIAPTAPNEDGSTGSGKTANGPAQQQAEQGAAQTVSL